MNIIEAAKLMKQGCKVRLGDWCGNEYLHNHLDMIRDERDEEHELSLCDVLDQGWEIYQDEAKLHTFEEALVAYKRGDTIIRNIDRPEQKRNIKDGIPCLFSRGDLLANDWIIEEKL